MLKAGIKNSEDFETRLHEIRKLIDMADAELRDGKGIEFTTSAALCDGIIRRSEAIIKSKY
jgi:hypothetical protein